MKKYECPCGYVYDPELGDPDNGVAPAPPGRTSRRIGYAPSAGWARTRLTRSKTFEEVAKRHFFEFFSGLASRGCGPLTTLRFSTD